jgi:hypothetical protein
MPVIVPATAAALPFASPTLADALARLRQDIFDPATPLGAAVGQVSGLVGLNPRWQDADLIRAIDRALDQYSFLSPWRQTVLVPAVGHCRLYPAPGASAAGAGGAAAMGAGPAWWVEAVEYPVGRYPRRFVPFEEASQPGLGVPAAPAASLAGAGSLSGSYIWRVTFLGVAGETAAGPASAPLSLTGGQALISLPLGPAPWCVGRRLYRTPANGADGSQLLVMAINDNASGSVIDNVRDSDLGGPLPAGDTTANAPLVELGLSRGRLPDPANPGTLAITYASKHVLGPGGTTVPEPHHDIVLLGAAAHACLAYQVPTNDLFDYQDGELRDHVSEIKTPEHWLEAGNALMARFQQRLNEVKQQRDGAYAATAQWGSIPARWEWT